jgi:RNA polymerase sigma-70 factor (ECF subfamily)
MSANAIPAPAAAVSTEALIEGSWERAYRFAAMVTRSDQEAADIAQEALLRALRSAGRYDPAQGPLESWLWRIVLNAARDAGRVAARRTALWDRLARQAPRPGPGVEELVLRRLDDAELLEAVRRLPKGPRTLIALRFGAGLSFQEIGGQLGLSEAAALMRTRRALDRLRADLKSREVSDA